MKIRWLIRPDLDSVLAIEDRSFDFPWTREDFLHHLSQRNCIGIVMEGRCGDVIAYAVYEQHKQRIELLNLAVHPDHRLRKVGDSANGTLDFQVESHEKAQVGAQCGRTQYSSSPVLPVGRIQSHRRLEKSLRSLRR